MNAVIQEAQALFAAAKARLTEFLEPEKALAERLEGVVHAIASEFHKLEDELRARIDALEAHPAVSIPAIVPLAAQGEQAAEVVSSEAAPAVAVAVEIPPPQVAPSTTDTPPASEPAAPLATEGTPST